MASGGSPLRLGARWPPTVHKACVCLLPLATQVSGPSVPPWRCLPHARRCPSSSTCPDECLAFHRIQPSAVSPSIAGVLLWRAGACSHDGLLSAAWVATAPQFWLPAGSAHPRIGVLRPSSCPARHPSCYRLTRRLHRRAPDLSPPCFTLAVYSWSLVLTKLLRDRRQLMPTKAHVTKKSKFPSCFFTLCSSCSFVLISDRWQIDAERGAGDKKNFRAAGKLSNVAPK